MKKTFDRDTIIRGLISIAVFVALFLLIKRLSGVLLPFLVSFVIAYMLAPIVDFFQHKCRLKNRVLSVIVTLVLAVGIVVGAVAALTPAISREMTTLSKSAKEFAANFDADKYLPEHASEQLTEFLSNTDFTDILSNPDIQQTIKNLLPKVGGWIRSGLSTLAGLAVVFVCLLYIIFLLIDYEKISKNWASYVPAHYRKNVQMLMSDLDKHMNGYFRGQALIAFIVGILFAIGFQIIGLPMGIAMGLIIGVFNLVPYMQALGIPPCILLGLIQSAETGRPVWVIALCITAVFCIVQSIQDLVLTPKIMGNVTGMGPAMILLCLSIWGSLLGVVGMIIALPITTLLVSYYKRFVLHIDDTQADSSTPPTPPEPATTPATETPEDTLEVFTSALNDIPDCGCEEQK